jgi:hypothetical protein
MGVAEAEDE